MEAASQAAAFMAVAPVADTTGDMVAATGTGADWDMGLDLELATIPGTATMVIRTIRTRIVGIRITPITILVLTAGVAITARLRLQPVDQRRDSIRPADRLGSSGCG
jgi:hypothetical protein